MKISVNVDDDSINVLALNMGRIAVDIEGIELSDLIAAVNKNGCTLKIADKPGEAIIESPLPPYTSLPGLRCSTAHITEADNNLLYTLSHQDTDFGESEWLHFTGYGYLLRLGAWSFPVLRLKRMGLSKACRRLVVTLIRRYSVSIIHLDASGEVLPGFATFDW